jgi:hypothetical protein
MFEAMNEDLLFEIEKHLVSNLKADSHEIKWKGTQVVRALNSCKQDVVTKMSQCIDMQERHQWRTVYLGIESMVSVLEWLNTGVPSNPHELQWK